MDIIIHMKTRGLIQGQVKTLDGAGYYPQAERNFLIGLTLKL